MPYLKTKPQSVCPWYRRVYDQLWQAILEERLRVRSTPPLDTARTLGVSQNTVPNAYEALVRDALLEARKGSGTQVGLPPSWSPDDWVRQTRGHHLNF
jgi:DNA-binding FadR family transcriptional regulator